MQQLAAAIKRKVPKFVCTYKPDPRQKVLDSWPREMDERSNVEWGWAFRQSLDEFVAKMLEDVKKTLPS